VFDDNLIILCGGEGEKASSPSKDIVFFNPSSNKIEKQEDSMLQLADKFVGGALSQFVISRMDCKIFFCSESFVHELDYGGTKGSFKLKCKATFY
jgi:hypothetical protein